MGGHMEYEGLFSIGGSIFTVRAGDPGHYDPHRYVYRWGSVSIDDSLYSNTGFKFDLVPAIWSGRIFTETGEVTHEWNQMYLSGRDFKKFQRDAKLLMKAVDAAGKREKGYPRSYRPKYSSIVDPVAEGIYGSVINRLPTNLVEVTLGRRGLSGNKPRNAVECSANFMTSGDGLNGSYRVVIAYDTAGRVIKANCAVHTWRCPNFEFKGKNLSGPFSVKVFRPRYPSSRAK